MSNPFMKAFAVLAVIFILLSAVAACYYLGRCIFRRIKRYQQECDLSARHNVESATHPVFHTMTTKALADKLRAQIKITEQKTTTFENTLPEFSKWFIYIAELRKLNKKISAWIKQDKFNRVLLSGDILLIRQNIHECWQFGDQLKNMEIDIWPKLRAELNDKIYMFGRLWLMEIKLQRELHEVMQNQLGGLETIIMTEQTKNSLFFKSGFRNFVRNGQTTKR